jgi:hypothetical protein
MFRNNTAHNGAVFYLNKQSLLNITDSVMRENVASIQGSVIFDEYEAADGEEKNFLLMSGSLVMDNRCKDWKCKVIYSATWERGAKNLINVVESIGWTALIIISLCALGCVLSAIVQLVLVFINHFKLKRNPNPTHV